jgi:asparagine synthase (glutamine-hydrolysing)
MCGIAGLVSLDGSGPDAGLLRRMNEAAAHRGPDGSGLVERGAVALAHRRLAIVGLGPSGAQPMLGDGGRLAVTYNGEIYNWIELREELRGLGHRFATDCDTEVLLAAWAQWGPRCVDRFNGMWAFAIHDSGSGRVFCSRDRFGVKPLLWARSGATVAFGSEPAQLLAFLGSRRADRAVVRGFLAEGIDEPADASFFEGIRKLPGGHSLTIDLAAGTISERREYSLAERIAGSDSAGNGAADEVAAGLRDSVSLRLRADVPVGTCLSGGLDSSMVASLAAPAYRAARGERFRSITAVSEDPANDESRWARMVTERAGLEWIVVRPGYEDFARTVDDVVRAQQEPFGGPSVCMQWFVMRTAREHGIPVLLDGQGGDETLLGYRRYYAAALIAELRKRGIPGALRLVRGWRRGGGQLALGSLAAHAAALAFPRVAGLKDRLRSSWMRDPAPVTDLHEAEAAACTDVRALQVLDIERANLPALLRFEDRNSMRFAVEARLPFLDWRLVEASVRLPPESKIRDGWTKWPLRAAGAGLLPDEVAWRRWKVGFEAPTARWLARHDGAMRAEVKRSGIVAELARPGAIERRWARMHWSVRWRIYCVAAWERCMEVA